MALHLNLAAYVALNAAFLFTLDHVAVAVGNTGASGSLSGLLTPYDELYYLGVRAYFTEAVMSSLLLLHYLTVCVDTEKGSNWDLWALDWIQQQAECIKFCLGRAVTPAGQLPVSTDIEYEFGTRNPYNFLQLTYYKLGKPQMAASAAHTFFVANPSHLEMRNNIEKYRRMDGVTEEAFRDRERDPEKHWVRVGRARSGEWQECVNETLKQTDECRAQYVCGDFSSYLVVMDSRNGLFLSFSALSLSLLSCKQMCVSLVSTRPGRISPQEDLLPMQLEHLHIAQYKGQRSSRHMYISQHWSDFGIHCSTASSLSSSLSFSPLGGPVPQVGVTITMDDDAMNGTNRVVLDGVLSQSECDTMMQLATSVGDGYRGRRSPHTPHEKFEGLTVLKALKLAQDGMVNQSDARLLHEMGERVRTLMHSYFRSHSILYFAYTHLVCRSAIPGHQEGRLDLSHPVHVDNCILEPETRQCWRELPAFTHRDLSAVLYLNDGFEGGEIFFTDRDAKTVTARVKPTCGRLVGFTSGPINPHGVTAVTVGRRCALALWFTTEKHHRDMVRDCSARISQHVPVLKLKIKKIWSE
uniref:procollagen-proline 3-dioxygenase n=1 Tax=Electrophorus electricus TaxID=8005 RepID=A0A4W4FMJ6_ELEEL